MTTTEEKGKISASGVVEVEEAEKTGIDGYERWILSEEKKERYRRNWEDGE